MSTTTLPVNGKATAGSKSKSVQQQRKKRVVRRRGRGPSGMGSDDEIEREAATDSDSDDDDRSSIDSATDDSDTEPASEDSPSRLESPPAPTVVGDVNGASAPFFATSSTWSDMVADEATHGAVGLPVVDFADFDGKTKVPARRAKKQKQKKQQQQQRQPDAATAVQVPPDAIAEERDPQSTVNANEAEEGKPADSGMRSDSMPPRKLGQTARQAYQQRLEADPSYVPKVGGFWGHDDRLMDKDLRSLSGWWRGKWSGRGGGRGGRGFGMRGAAHGGGLGHEGHEFKSADLPPVERQWTHDGFEEMKRKEDHKRQDRPPSRGRGGNRGGRGRGRGGAFGSSWQAHSLQEGELAESRRSEAALFEEVKGKGGKVAIQVKLPGKGAKIAHSKGPINAKAPVPASEKAPAASTTHQPQCTVKLPQGKPKAPAAASQQPTVPPTAPTEGPSSEVQPAVALPTAFPDSSIISQLGQLSLAVTPSNPERQAQTEEAVLRKAGSATSAEGNPEPDTATSDQRPALPPLQTVFTPPPPPPMNHQSPTFGSPYNFPQALPPGIAMNQHGMPYEVATGRPVYLQPPPPQPMYNPQPMHYPPPGMYMHGPMHHPIASPDYHAQPSSHTPPVNGFVDPATGQPIFALPRSVRIEIRAPSEARGPHNPSSSPQASAKPPTATKLRTGATSFEPSREFSHVNRTPSEGSSHQPSYEGYEGNGHQQPQQQQYGHPQMMHYGGYQHQGYYYPEAYGYPAYMDMGHGQYETYNPEQGQQGTGYY